MIINASIDLTKIDKSKIKEHQNGAKYYNISIFVNDQPDQYGNNVAIANSQTKEERESGQKRVYIGNGKTNMLAPTPAIPSGPPAAMETEDDLPF
jgi:hypothetical protein